NRKGAKTGRDEDRKEDTENRKGGEDGGVSGGAVFQNQNNKETARTDCLPKNPRGQLLWSTPLVDSSGRYL
ncbi:MAG: hypothetical protein IJ954_04410, partial [Bacteroidales bacterium]|nr:hypothetical protein [Bacteroidales bacterium]